MVVREIMLHFDGKTFLSWPLAKTSPSSVWHLTENRHHDRDAFDECARANILVGTVLLTPELTLVFLFERLTYLVVQDVMDNNLCAAIGTCNGCLILIHASLNSYGSATTGDSGNN